MSATYDSRTLETRDSTYKLNHQKWKKNKKLLGLRLLSSSPRWEAARAIGRHTVELSTMLSSSTSSSSAPSSSSSRLHPPRARSSTPGRRGSAAQLQLGGAWSAIEDGDRRVGSETRIARQPLPQVETARPPARVGFRWVETRDGATASSPPCRIYHVFASHLSAAAAGN